MKLEVGMYVRTDLGEIAKIISSKHYKNETGDYNYLHDDNNLKYAIYDDLANSHVIKSSYNIIDLIEVGDYVNGFKVVKIFQNQINKKKVLISLQREYEYEYSDNFNDYMCDESIHIYNEDIQSIATKEQFKNINYEVRR